MNIIKTIFSTVNIADFLAPEVLPQPSNPWLSEVLRIVGLILALFCVAMMVIWVLRERKTSLVSERAESDNPNSSNTFRSFFNKHRRRKYKRRFPTLAEKGGLPPKREEQTRESSGKL